MHLFFRCCQGHIVWKSVVSVSVVLCGTVAQVRHKVTVHAEMRTRNVSNRLSALERWSFYLRRQLTNRGFTWHLFTYV